ncbi:MAG: hypothetical protein AABX99_01145 [Nanoarchaeota archaeon]
MRNKKISRLLPLALVGLSLLGVPKISTQEVRPEGIEKILDETTQEIHSPKMDFAFDYEFETKPKEPEYSKYISYPNLPGENLVRSINLPLNKFEIANIENLIREVKNKKINSYSDFIGVSKTFSEFQKMVLFASISEVAYKGTYNWRSFQNKIESQETFFNNIQNFLETGVKTPSGECGQIAVNIERLINDLGIKSASVTGMDKIGHVFDILRLIEQIGIVDGGKIIVANTKNTEKLLRIYQQDANFIAFQHLFFEDNQFKYMLIPEDGRNFLDFIGYDISSKPIKDSLINLTKSNSKITFTTNQEKELTSFKMNYLGFLVRAGQITGNSSFPLEDRILVQAGFKRKFSFSGIEATPNTGIIFQNNKISGGVVELIVNSTNEKGLNLSSRISGNILVKERLINKLFYDYSAGVGVSYKIKTKLGELEPYSITQFKLMLGDLGMQIFVPTLNEAEFGLKLDIPFSNDSNISFNPYYMKRLWEQEFGANAKVQTRNFGLNIGSYLTKSNYAFCPDKFGFDAELSASINKYFNLKAKYKTEQTNYEGEKENKDSFSLTAGINFN